ncbi:hypothetical protein EST38_g2147 [Candolleomyces aberdarensis]|uniref:Glucose receptor Git3 N-terminal domain-containing protein n=1 Tax=Candolleomyces aberdarensis TaxID=2316362 RepID=A0A4V1Q4Y2_9AGAR|nr:hypothetical protein EST38_g2147 [Candolleomyces aberdarensis]
MSTSLTESGTGSDVRVFPFSERISMLFTVEAAALSGISIMVLITYKLYRTVLRALLRRETYLPDACDSSLFLTLMFGEALRVVGNVMTVKWVADATITAPSTFCYTQGAVKALSSNIIDWSTLAITIHTFVILVLQWNAPIHIAKYLALGVWLIAGFIVGITLGVKGVEIIGPAGFWCWVRAIHRTEQILIEYLWMWIILVLTIIFYGIDALVIQGYVVIENRFRPRFVRSQDRVHLKLTRADSVEERARKEIAVQLLFGGFNVVLFFVTRRDLITGGTLPNSSTEKGGYDGATPAPQNPPEHGHLPVTEGGQRDTPRSMPSFDPYAPSTSRGTAGLDLSGNAEDHNGWRNGYDKGGSQQAGQSGRARMLPQKRQASENPATQMTPSAQVGDDDDQGFLPP